MTLLFWTIVAFSALALTWLARLLYEWQEKRCRRREAQRRLRTLFWRGRP
jgi:biopolymer transport protein ExbB/TolQ